MGSSGEGRYSGLMYGSTSNPFENFYPDLNLVVCAVTAVNSGSSILTVEELLI